MTFPRPLRAAFALAGLLLAGCTSALTEQSQYSGFLHDYHGLQQAITPSGQPVLRWVEPGFDPAAYSTVVFDQLQLYPAPKPDERVDLQTLEALQRYTSSIVRQVLQQRYRLLSSQAGVATGERTLILRAAITGVSASNQGMRWYEVLPVGAVLGAASRVTGLRDQNSELYIESDFVDAATGQPVVKVVRKVFGESLDNARQPITADDFKAAIKDVSSDLNSLLAP